MISRVPFPEMYAPEKKEEDMKEIYFHVGCFMLQIAGRSLKTNYKKEISAKLLDFGNFIFDDFAVYYWEYMFPNRRSVL